MKIINFAALAACAALGLVSCDKSDPALEQKLSELEKKATEVTERQRQLEQELADRELAEERDAIERERTLIEQERIAMEESRDEQDTAAAEELAKRQRELAEREKRISENQQQLDAREQELTGLEWQLEQKQGELAGREPLDSLPPLEDIGEGSATGDFDDFYQPLAAYGSWFQTVEYGYVYQPSVVCDVSWRPYSRGRWAFTGQGWTWVSSEPFGWACYHYGRWARLRNTGWVWVPGSEWAPAWVTWRESPGHVGWAPLPPETLAWRGRSWDSSVELKFGIGSGSFSFVSYRNFGNSIQRYCLPVSGNGLLIRSSTNITRYQVDKHRVFVGGPRYDRVCKEIGRKFPVHHLRVNQRPDFGRRSQLGNRISGRDLKVVAPCMEVDWNQALRPRRVSRDLGKVIVERSRKLPDDVRKYFNQRRIAETYKAEKVVADAGGRQRFERERREHRDKGRERMEQRRNAISEQEGRIREPQEAERKAIEERQGRMREQAETRSKTDESAQEQAREQEVERQQRMREQQKALRENAERAHEEVRKREEGSRRGRGREEQMRNRRQEATRRAAEEQREQMEKAQREALKEQKKMGERAVQQREAAEKAQENIRQRAEEQQRREEAGNRQEEQLEQMRQRQQQQQREEVMKRQREKQAGQRQQEKMQHRAQEQQEQASKQQGEPQRNRIESGMQRL
ncbi:MAG: hypothetical protein OSA84_05410, partial [Akkermansiaceae bacterium]|nr:hypothetical protein [Akkermansiaceae bacterium]